MSRVAKAPVVVPAGVDVKINGQVITIKGKNGELTRTLNDAVEVKHADNTLTFGPRDGYADGWGKKLYDKRNDIAKKDQKREAQREFKVRNL